MAGIIPFIVGEDSDEVTATTYLGTPVFSSFVFSEVQEEGLTELDLQTVLISVDKTKNVIETPVQNRAGSVKEYISDGDYRINLSGALVSKERTVAPVEDAELLDRFCSLGQALEVGSTFLQIFDVLSVVVLDYTISERRGTRNTYDFKINMVSDNPIELDLSEAVQVDLEQQNTDTTNVA
jgi:hypothetical protein